jgi:hypothetical protein
MQERIQTESEPYCRTLSDAAEKVLSPDSTAPATWDQKLHTAISLELLVNIVLGKIKTFEKYFALHAPEVLQIRGMLARFFFFSSFMNNDFLIRYAAEC